MGAFHPTTMGEHLMALITGVSPALIALSSAIKQDCDAGSRWRHAPGEIARRFPTEYADFASAERLLESLDLTVRDARGRFVKTRWIAVHDTELLLSLEANDPFLANEHLNDPFS